MEHATRERFGVEGVREPSARRFVYNDEGVAQGYGENRPSAKPTIILWEGEAPADPDRARI